MRWMVTSCTKSTSLEINKLFNRLSQSGSIHLTYMHTQKSIIFGGLAWATSEADQLKDYLVDGPSSYGTVLTIPLIENPALVCLRSLFVSRYSTTTKNCYLGQDNVDETDICCIKVSWQNILFHFSLSKVMFKLLWRNNNDGTMTVLVLVVVGRVKCWLDKLPLSHRLW